MKKIKLFIKDTSEKLKDNTSFFYYLISGVIVLGLIFFLLSGTVFNKDIKVRSTNLNEIQVSNSLNAKILSRQYNPLTHAIEFIVCANDPTNFDGKELSFELREQANTNETIETRFKLIDKDYYIVFAKVPKKWSVLSLSLGYKSSDNTYENELDNKSDLNQNTLLSIIRIYSDVNDIKTNSLMKEKSSEQYFEEIISIEIKNLNKEIDALEKKNNSEKDKIKDAKIKIEELEADKKYQTESEQNLTSTNIGNLENVISNAENLIKENEKNIKELKDKVSMFVKKSREKNANLQ